MAEQQAVTQAPALLRFLDSFLQEANIKWLLAIGSLILLCSSVMLVANHWGSYPPFWQYLIMFGYTGFIYLASRWSYYRIALLKTGTGLMVLTVLLQPALFFALGWMPMLASGGILQYLLLLGLTILFAVLTANRLLQHLLKGQQPTFLASFLLLSLAYALLPLLPTALLPWAMAIAWLIFTLGTVKVNRHVFWLAEQHQAPRIFGFFPIALLGALFLGLFAQYGIGLVAFEWLGLACILAAIPVLLTANAVAAVFAQRSGGLIEQRPLAIIIPVLVGLLLCVAGILLAVTGLLPGRSPQAIAPTALLAAAMVFLVAYRTEKQSLVWAALVCVTLAYNFSPFYFLELARGLLSSGANAVAEERLPIAFYGLSYLPLLLLLTAAAVRTERLGLTLFAAPLRRFSGILAALLILPAYTHPKALLPVAAVLSGLFFMQAVVYRRRWTVSVALLMLISAAVGIMPFGRALLGWYGWWNDFATWLLAAAALLLAVSSPLQAWVERLPSTHRWLAKLPGAAGWSLALTLLLTLYYAVGTIFGVMRIPLSLALFALLAAHCLRWLNWRLSAYTLLFGYAALLANLASWGVDALWQPLCLTLLAVVSLAVSSVWRARSETIEPSRRYLSIARPLAVSAWLVGGFNVALSLGVYALPLWLAGGLANLGLLAIAKLRRQPLSTTLGLIILNWQMLALGIVFGSTRLLTLQDIFTAAGLAMLPPLALAAAVSSLLWQQSFYARKLRQIESAAAIIDIQRLLLGATSLLFLAASLLASTLPPLTAVSALATFLLWAWIELRAALVRQNPIRVWSAELLLALGVGYFAAHGLISFGSGLSPLLLLGAAALGATISAWTDRQARLAVLTKPLRQTALSLPMIAVTIVIVRVLIGSGAAALWPGVNSLTLLLTAGAYAWYGYKYAQRWAQLAALMIGNIALVLLWQELSFNDPQFYLVPIGGSILLLRWLLREQLLPRLHTPLNYLGALTILVSPLFNIITGSWLHIFSLMLLAVTVIVLAIGLRVRALIYTGSAFLFTDLIAMMVRGGIDHPSLLWLAGLLLGAAVIALAALAERHREELLQRLRLMSAALENWQ